MQKDYDEIIDDHYRKVAEKHGLSSASTMEDAIMRSRETTRCSPGLRCR